MLCSCGGPLANGLTRLCVVPLPLQLLLRGFPDTQPPSSSAPASTDRAGGAVATQPDPPLPPPWLPPPRPTELRLPQRDSGSEPSVPAVLRQQAALSSVAAEVAHHGAMQRHRSIFPNHPQLEHRAQAAVAAATVLYNAAAAAAEENAALLLGAPCLQAWLHVLRVRGREVRACASLWPAAARYAAGARPPLLR